MRIVFLDRDGVINEKREDHVKSLAEFRLLPGALDALALLSGAGFRIFIVTNQACVNRGLLSHSGLEAIHRRLRRAAAARGATIEAIRYCPHRPDEQCGCRKPRPGMLLDLARTHGLRLREAYMVGDALTDVAAGQGAGCRTLLIRTGRAAAPALERGQGAPTAVVESLLAAARWICAAEGIEGPAAAEPPHLSSPREQTFPC